MFVFTIGVYGFTSQSFFDAIKHERIRVLYDIRRRCGVRGSKYIFANRHRLEESLHELGVRYVPLKSLAPPQELRIQLQSAEKELGISKSDRSCLPGWWIEAYKLACLVPFDFEEFIRGHGDQEQRIAFLCVEQFPEQCHRSIVANELAKKYGLERRDLLP